MNSNDLSDICKLRSFPDWNLFQYDVSIAPGERIPPSLARDIFKRLLDTRFKEFGEILCFYDGRAYLIAPKRLPFSEKTFDDINVPNPADPTKERKFSFTIKFASEVNMQELVEHINGRFPGIPRPAIQALEIVLTAHACSLLVLFCELYLDVLGTRRKLDLSIRLLILLRSVKVVMFGWDIVNRSKLEWGKFISIWMYLLQLS